MKTNLSSIYSTDKDVEKEGKWFELTETVSFKMKRMGGSNGTRLNEIRSKYFKPYARQIKNDTLDKKLQEKLFISVFVDACMVNWKGLIDNDDTEIKYDRDTAVMLFQETPDLFDELVAMADDRSNYQEETQDLGNS